ncbi:hypothetical protein RJ55_02855 [Drechmeria coniospora]|nr:hypothetical protein RJ55_02855 [Drechmeria coniospora]
MCDGKLAKGSSRTRPLARLSPHRLLCFCSSTAKGAWSGPQSTQSASYVRVIASEDGGTTAMCGDEVELYARVMRSLHVKAGSPAGRMREQESSGGDATRRPWKRIAPFLDPLIRTSRTSSQAAAAPCCTPAGNAIATRIAPMGAVEFLGTTSGMLPWYLLMLVLEACVRI